MSNVIKKNKKHKTGSVARWLFFYTDTGLARSHLFLGPASLPPSFQFLVSNAVAQSQESVDSFRKYISKKAI